VHIIILFTFFAGSFREKTNEQHKLANFRLLWARRICCSLATRRIVARRFHGSRCSYTTWHWVDTGWDYIVFLDKIQNSKVVFCFHYFSILCSHGWKLFYSMYFVKWLCSLVSNQVYRHSLKCWLLLEYVLGAPKKYQQKNLVNFSRTIIRYDIKFIH